MLFNSIEFIIFFMIVIISITLLKFRQFQHIFLLIASYFFFYYTSNYLISLLFFSTLLDFNIAKKIWTCTSIKGKKILLILSLVGNLGLLGLFKYADFAILQFNILGNYLNLNSEIPFLNLALPIGISFYTFQTISYTVDVYRGNLEPSKSLKEFALYVAFFPQLVAGPIVRATEFLPQLREKIQASETSGKVRQIIIHNSNLKLGLTLMVIGFFKKMFFADNIAPFVDEIFRNPIGLDSFSIIFGSIAFGLQVYGDFSGYSDIAIGAALILGFKIPANFNKPFFANSPADFWRRWHISLSSWVRDYLFLPIVYRKIGSDLVLISGVMITFVLLGLWHGAGWNFIIFGLIHGIYVAFEIFIRRKFPSLANNRFFKTKFGRFSSILITQYLVFLAWISFRVEDMNHLNYSMQKFIFLDLQVDGVLNLMWQNKTTTTLVFLFILLQYFSYRQNNLLEKISNLSLKYWGLVLSLIIILVLLFFTGNPADFIYFRF